MERMQQYRVDAEGSHWRCSSCLLYIIADIDNESVRHHCPKDKKVLAGVPKKRSKR